MANERTISIIKPDAVAKNAIGDIYSRFEKSGLNIVAARMMHLSKEQAEGEPATYQFLRVNAHFSMIWLVL